MREARWEQLELFTQRLLIDPWDEDAARHYGFIRALLKKPGTTIGNNDLLIACAKHECSIGYKQCSRI